MCAAARLPVPENQLFSIEILLRVTSAVEMLLVLAGMLLGALFNPALPAWSALAALYAVFNLILAVACAIYWRAC